MSLAVGLAILRAEGPAVTDGLRVVIDVIGAGQRQSTRECRVIQGTAVWTDKFRYAVKAKRGFAAQVYLQDRDGHVVSKGALVVRGEEMVQFYDSVEELCVDGDNEGVKVHVRVSVKPLNDSAAPRRDAGLEQRMEDMARELHEVRRSVEDSKPPPPPPPPPVTPPLGFCTTCGAHAEDGAKYCWECGMELPAPVQAKTQQQQQHPTVNTVLQQVRYPSPRRPPVNPSAAVSTSVWCEQQQHVSLPDPLPSGNEATRRIHEARLRRHTHVTEATPRVAAAPQPALYFSAKSVSPPPPEPRHFRILP